MGQSSTEGLGHADTWVPNDSLEDMNGVSNNTDDKTEIAIVETETASYYLTRNYSISTGYDEAIEKYEDVIKWNPYDNNAYHNLAFSFFIKSSHIDVALRGKKDSIKNVILARNISTEILSESW
ncbi:MAG: hypothetical protein ACE5GV_13055 [Candidatus Scalindua sp.]